MEIIEPERFDLLRSKPAQKLFADLVTHGCRNGDIPVCSSGDPVEPLVENLHQPGVVELWMGQRDQVVDYRDDVHPFTLELFGHGKKVGVPGRIQQHQLITRLMLQRCATFRQLFLVHQPDQT